MPSKFTRFSEAADHRFANVSIRVWLDTAFFSSEEVQILKDLITNSSGRMVISGETHGAFLSTKGAYVPQSWDLYWTVRRACHSVLGAIAPPKRVNCVPGVEAVAHKQPLVRTMQEAYGEAAFDYIPRSYMLPSQYWVWRSWTQRSSSPPEVPWVLKANDHRGRGVRVMRQKQAQRQALRGSGARVAGDTATQTGFVLVQSYVQRQFLYDNRPSYLRLWVVVTSVRPLRAYLFRGGVLVFGDRLGPSGRGRGGSATAARQGTSSQRSSRRLLSQLREAAQTQSPWMDRAARDSWNSNDSNIRRHLHQKQQEQHLGLGKNPQQYEMHQVNYWTISGEKVHPWTVGQLRRHVEAVHPNDPKIFERMWAHAGASVGMVLASAARRMRTAARGLAALEGSGFEVLGIDFLLNATLHPTLVEVNALPSLARLRLAPGDPVHAAAGGSTDGLAAGRADSPTHTAQPGPTPPFDLEKERFLHHMLRLIGMPIGPPPFRGGDFNTNTTGAADPAAATPTAGAGASREAASPSVGGVLRAMVALLRPPNNETADLQAFLSLHLPLDVAAAEMALPNLRSLLCPVPAAWGPAPGWPVVETETVAVESTGSGSRRLVAAATAQDAARQHPELIAERMPMGWGDMKRHVALGQVPKRSEGSGGGGIAQQGNGATRANDPTPLQRVQYSDSNAAAAASAKTAIMAAALGLDGTARISLSERTAPEQTDDSPALRRQSLQGATAMEAVKRGGGRRVLIEDSASWASGHDGGDGTAGAQMQQPCRRRCYDWDVLAAIADTEYELQQNLDFDPIFPLAAAHDLNRAALQAAERVAAAGMQTSQTREEARGSSGIGSSSGSGSTGSASGSETFAGSALLGPQTGLQKLQTGLNFVRESITSVSMDMMRSMRYMTTTPYVLARTALPYSRIDAALGAYEAVRRRGGSCLARISANKAAAAVESSTCAVQVLQDTLAELCSGRMKPEQG
ncbi:hypothetical protein Vretimale_2070 [Volvox reticuliferus]|nr:hypothetical protein Vretimale_2070 [Volvox reticuliferus]